METRITIRMDNAAFEEGASTEVARILSDLATRVDEYFYQQLSDGHPQPLQDVNGNRVGFVFVVGDVDVNDPPAWALGQDPYRCEGCGSFLIDNGAEEPTCWECDA